MSNLYAHLSNLPALSVKRVRLAL